MALSQAAKAARPRNNSSEPRTDLTRANASSCTHASSMRDLSHQEQTAQRDEYFIRRSERTVLLTFVALVLGCLALAAAVWWCLLQ
jgi:hypothetical protein